MRKRVRRDGGGGGDGADEVPEDVLRPVRAPAAPLDPATEQPARERVYRHTDALLAAARRIAAAAAACDGGPARPWELAHARTLLALRRACVAYSYERTPAQRAHVLFAAVRLNEVVAPAYSGELAATLAPQLRELGATPGFGDAVESRRRDAVIELVGAAYLRSTLAGAALLCGAAWADLSARQHARLVSAYGAHARGTPLWRLREALQPHHQAARPGDAARRIGIAMREVVAPAEPALAAYIMQHAYAAPGEPAPLHDASFGVPALLVHLRRYGSAGDGTRGAVDALADAVRRAVTP